MSDWLIASSGLTQSEGVGLLERVGRLVLNEELGDLVDVRLREFNRLSTRLQLDRLDK